MKFKMVIFSTVKAFEKEINTLLSKGWELHGNPFLSETGCFCQALVSK